MDIASLKKTEALAKGQGFGPGFFAGSCDTCLTQLFSCLQENGVDDFQGRYHHKTSRFVTQGRLVHLNLQQLLEKVVLALGREVEVRQLLEASAAKWHSWRRSLPAVQPVQIATANVRAMGFQGYFGLFELVHVLSSGIKTTL